jgi:hypothetical protein
VIFENRYSRLDRLLHRLAFRTGAAQEALADIEATAFRRALDSTPSADPVFITALPRAGTTILLNLLWSMGRFASPTYRDMPFVLCPLLWSRFTGAFAVEDTPRERAHGDGMEVSGSSPEAFEETVWKRFWPRHYTTDRIVPWEPGEENAEFNAFFERHMKKIVIVRRRERPAAQRYLSKNNASIARLAARTGPMATGTLLVPFREPVQHAASMLLQHRRFLEIHAEDDFTRRYMSAIGHHEFGSDLRPVDFDGWLADAPEPGGLEFWLRYWITAYAHILDHLGPSVVLVSYDRLTGQPDEALPPLADVLGVPGSELLTQSGRLRSPRHHDVDPGEVPGALRRQASQLYRELLQEARV